MKLIINTDDKITDADATYYAMMVMREGKISDNETAYCHVTTFKNGVQVIAKKTKTGHSFWIHKP